MLPSAAVISLKFSPGHIEQIVATARLFQELDCRTTLLLDEGYLRFIDIGVEVVTGTTAALTAAKSRRFEIGVIQNAAVTHSAIAAKMQRAGTRVLYVMHEPNAVRNHLSEGWPEIVKLAGSALCSRATLRNCDDVVVPSKNARDLFERYHAGFRGNRHVIPLLFEDGVGQLSGRDSLEERRYISFVGSAIKVHNIDNFVAVAKLSAHLQLPLRFAIFTKTDLSSLLQSDRELRDLIAQGAVHVQHGSPLTREDMRRAYLQSYCVWAVYRQSTQSGVLPHALMAGTPVIATRTGSFEEYVSEGATGEFVSAIDDHRQILDAIQRIVAHSEHYIKASRQAFIDGFYYRNYLPVYSALLRGVRTPAVVTVGG